MGYLNLPGLQRHTDRLLACIRGNLLDNATYCINQREQSAYTLPDGRCGYDRWMGYLCMQTAAQGTMTVTASSYTAPGYSYQRVPYAEKGFGVGDTMSLGVTVNGTRYTATFVIAAGTSHFLEPKIITQSWGTIGCHIISASGYAVFCIGVAPGKSIRVSQPKLELGSLATPYVPKGYGAELAECRRYYLKMDPVVKVYCNDAQYGQPRVSLSLGTVMRVTPTFTLTQGYKSSNLASTSVDGTKTTAYLTLNPSAAGMLQSNSVVEASADL